MEDVDVSKVSTNKLLLHALVNLKNENPEVEGGYAVRHGRVPVFDLPIAAEERESRLFSNKFDVLAAAFPVLWPYREGRWDVPGKQR